MSTAPSSSAHPGGPTPHHATAAPVTVEHLSYRHPGRRDPAFSDLSFRIAPGERVMLLGASGSGKSTLLAALAGVLDDGDLSGHVDTGDSPVGLVLQDPDSQVIASRVVDDVIFGCENLGLPRDDIYARVDPALRSVGLDVPWDWPTHQLSGGQKQRLALAGVLAMAPGVILLDEPTANLDPAGAAEVVEAVTRTHSTLLVVEHTISTWIDHMDRVIVLDGGRIIADGAPEEILHTHAERLADAGMWVPGIPVDLPELPAWEAQPAAATPQGAGAVQKAWIPHNARTPEAGRDARGEATGALPASASVIRTEELAIGHPGAAVVQRGLNLKHPGGSAVLTGDNGAGKTTLALTLGGLLEPRGGQVRTPVGKPLHRLRSSELIRQVGYVFQDPEHQFAARTVMDELLLGPRAVGMDATAAQHRAEELLDIVGLRRYAQASPYTLSGGEKRRLSVATMLATTPRLLILDEPTFGQDRRSFRALVGHLQELVGEGYHLLSITHDPTYLRLMGQHHWHLERTP